MNSIFKKVAELTGLDVSSIESAVADFGIDQLYELISATKMGDRQAVMSALSAQTMESQAITDSRLLQLAGRPVSEDDEFSLDGETPDYSEVSNFGAYGLGGYFTYRQRLGSLQVVDAINQVIEMLPMTSSIDHQLLKDATNRLVSAVDRLANKGVE